MSIQTMKEIRNNFLQKIEIGQTAQLTEHFCEIVKCPQYQGKIVGIRYEHQTIDFKIDNEHVIHVHPEDLVILCPKETQSITGVDIDSVSRQVYKAIVQECLGFMEQAQTMLYDIAFICSECLDPDNLIDIWQDNTKWNARMFICPTRIAFCPGLNHESQTFAIHQKNTSKWKELQITAEPSYPLVKEPNEVVPDDYKFAITVTLVNCSI